MGLMIKNFVKQTLKCPSNVSKTICSFEPWMCKAKTSAFNTNWQSDNTDYRIWYHHLLHHWYTEHCFLMICHSRSTRSIYSHHPDHRIKMLSQSLKHHSNITDNKHLGDNVKVVNEKFQTTMGIQGGIWNALNFHIYL